MRTTVKKWGNSASVRLPAAVMQAANLELDDPVEVTEDGGKIIIEPVRPRPRRLEELLDGITPENVHDEIDFGPSVGRETP